MPERAHRPTEHYGSRELALGEAEQYRIERDRLKAQYGDLYEEILAILFRHDPIGINFDENVDEYDPEVRTILPRLLEAGAPEDVERIVREEFARWFGEDIAFGSNRAATYHALAADVWVAWRSR